MTVSVFIPWLCSGISARTFTALSAGPVSGSTRNVSSNGSFNGIGAGSAE